MCARVTDVSCREDTYDSASSTAITQPNPSQALASLRAPALAGNADARYYLGEPNSVAC